MEQDLRGIVAFSLWSGVKNKYPYSLARELESFHKSMNIGIRLYLRDGKR